MTCNDSFNTGFSAHIHCNRIVRRPLQDFACDPLALDKIVTSSVFGISDSSGRIPYANPHVIEMENNLRSRLICGTTECQGVYASSLRLAGTYLGRVVSFEVRLQCGDVIRHNLVRQ